MTRNITEQNLKNAFSGESQAHMRHLIFAGIAEGQGYPNTARLFKAVSLAEQVHSTNHYRNLAYLNGGFLTVGMAGFGPGDTFKNLGIAIEGESFEVEEMYPTYLETARFQGEEGAAKSFQWAYEAEKTHAGLFKKAKESVDAGVDPPLGKVQVCRVCGYTVEGDAPEECPVCKAKRGGVQSLLTPVGMMIQASAA